MKTKITFAILMFAFAALLDWKTKIAIEHNTAYLIGLFWGLGCGILLGMRKWFNE